MISDKRKIAEIVLEKIEEKFLHSQLEIGEKLPSERELAALFEVSRNSVREALQTLALKGVIEIRQGGGSFVKQSDADFIREELSGKVVVNENHLIFEMLEVRRALEVEAASLAAQRATAEDLNKLRKSLEEMDVSIDKVKIGAQADFQFHMHIVEASHNSILIHLAQTLNQQLEKTVYTTRQHRFVNPDRYEETITEHKEIYIAIASGDSALAGSLMEAHITKVRKELSERSLLA